jgi:hypothetical protein
VADEVWILPCRLGRRHILQKWAGCPWGQKRERQSGKDARLVELSLYLISCRKWSFSVGTLHFFHELGSQSSPPTLYEIFANAELPSDFRHSHPVSSAFDQDIILGR